MELLWGFYYIGLTSLLIGFGWKVLSFIFATIINFFGDKQKVLLIVTIGIIPIYFETSIMVIIGNTFIGNQKSSLLLFIGAIYFFFSYFQGIARGRSEANSQLEYNTFTYQYYTLLLGCIYYVFASFYLNLAENNLTISILDFMYWLSNIVFLKWILLIVVSFYLISFLFNFLSFLVAGFIGFFSRNR